LSSAIYGLCEINREQIKNATLVANPGCYPTVIQLALKPLIDNKLISVACMPRIMGTKCGTKVSPTLSPANKANSCLISG
jgi:N-acetyl-gamma-glutamyl-phosphate reductase